MEAIITLILALLGITLILTLLALTVTLTILTVWGIAWFFNLGPFS